MKPARIAALFAAVAIGLLSGSIVFAQLKSPDDVKTALRILVQVSNDFKRQITNKSFARVPHENQEFKEAADGLRSAIKDEPDDFKAKVEARLKDVVAAEQKVSDDSANATDADALMAEQNKSVTSLNALFDLFPAELRPDPNAAPQRRGPPKAQPQ